MNYTCTVLKYRCEGWNEKGYFSSFRHHPLVFEKVIAVNAIMNLYLGFPGIPDCCEPDPAG